MQANEFRTIVASFADPGVDLLFDKNQLVISVNGDLIEATVTASSGEIHVDEGDGPQPASQWIVNRLARLPLLASRLLSNVTPTEYFVSPNARLLSTLERKPQEEMFATNSALDTTLMALKERSPLETTVLYITSDAGEGKTSLINELARVQAKAFVDKKSDWLLLPIPLGGRHFLRFDDITIGALQNRYRFQFLYYNSFLALVKMGVIVPAFDGFEEMFVENSSGEALSAMGILVGSLDSQGAMLIAARKAYFEFENLRTQERLFDTIRTYAVGFAKLELDRWGRQQFIEYCRKREVADPDELYRRVSERLGSEHALLTRAVLVKRLVDVATASPTLDDLLGQLQKSGADFFSVFVRGLIEREAAEKWIDRSGEKAVGTPLLGAEEHCELLSHIALTMWDTRVDYLKRDSLEFVADYFCESNRKNAFQAQQIRERILYHAMLVPSTNSTGAVEFDHDEFRFFFLGEGVAQQLKPLNERAKADLLGTFRRGVLPKQAQDALIRALMRVDTIDRLNVVNFLLSVAALDVQASYTQENCSDIVIRLLSGVPGKGQVVGNMVFGADALRDRKLSNISFNDCYFSQSSMDLTELRDCAFVRCHFAQIRLTHTSVIEQVAFNDCKVDALVLADRDLEIWDPIQISQQLRQLGVNASGESDSTMPQSQLTEPDPKFRDMEKIIRYFMRSTHISESVLMIKLGERGQGFIDHTLPALLKADIMEEIENRGGGDQRRFRLKVSLQALNAAITAAGGSFSVFLGHMSGNQ